MRLVVVLLVPVVVVVVVGKRRVSQWRSHLSHHPLKTGKAAPPSPIPPTPHPTPGSTHRGDRRSVKAHAAKDFAVAQRNAVDEGDVQAKVDAKEEYIHPKLREAHALREKEVVQAWTRL